LATTRPRVLLADDFPDLVKAVSRLLALDCEVVGTVAGARTTSNPRPSVRDNGAAITIRIVMSAVVATNQLAMMASCERVKDMRTSERTDGSRAIDSGGAQGVRRNVSRSARISERADAARNAGGRQQS